MRALASIQIEGESEAIRAAQCMKQLKPDGVIMQLQQELAYPNTWNIFLYGEPSDWWVIRMFVDWVLTQRERDIIFRRVVSADMI